MIKQAEAKNIANFHDFLWLFQDKVVTLYPMNELSHHIEHLLLTHDCVVVPLFGAFVARISESTREEQENLFFPPLRTVRFNPEITKDDGLLVGEIQSYYRCSTTEAKRSIQAMVLRLRQQLLSDGQVDFGTIGVFAQDEDGQVTFSSCQAGVTTPEFYGLDAFFMPKLKLKPATTRKDRQRQQLQQLQTEEDRDRIVIHLSRRALRRTAAFAAAAVVLACAIFLLPTDLLRQKNIQRASILPNERTEPVTEPATNVKKSESVNAKASKDVTPALAIQDGQAVQASNTTKNNNSSETAVAPQSSVNNYAVVLASSISRRNAERFIGELNEKGIKAHTFEKGKMLRVVIDGFATETDAYNECRQIQSMGGELEAAWVMKL